MTDFAKSWPNLMERILRIWPETDRDKMLELDGHRESFVEYLSSCHELTKNEADDLIDTWLLPGHVSEDAPMMAAE